MKATSPRVLLQLEGLVALVTVCVLYAHAHFNWGFFALLFFVPDLSMLGYFAGKRTGAVCYNLAHTYAIPLLIFVLLMVFSKPEYDWLPLIWIAHIGFDRLMGYGIKYETAFKDTHLQRV